MDLRHARTFVALSQELHFGRTAKRLRIAQSAVSQTIRSLEDEIGAQLFSRAERKVRLTPAGMALLPHVEQALSSLEVGFLRAREAASGEIGNLALGFGPLGTLTVVPNALMKFRRRWPRIDVRVETSVASAQLAAVRAGTLDMCFVPLSKHDVRGLAIETVAESAVVALLPARHRLSERRTLAFRDLSGEPLLLLDQTGDPDLRARVLERARRESFVPGPLTEVGHLEALLAFVAAEAGISILPDVVRSVVPKGIKVVPLKPSVAAPIVAVWNAARVSAAAARFLEVIRASLPANVRGR